MAIDRFSGEHAHADQRAIAAFERAVWNILAHRPDTASALGEATTAAPDFVAAHALRGFCGVSLARSETIVDAREQLATARAALRSGAATASETALVDALALAVDGRLRAAADRFDAHLAEKPHDLLALKLSHALRFMSGDARGMLNTTQAALKSWSKTMDGYGFALGCHAFALEENGRLLEAERAGRDAVGLEPCDAWGAHAVGHVYEMTNRTKDGVRWLEQTRPMWAECNNFGFHMAWHLALYHLADGRADIALQIYDSHVRPTSTDDFRDVANAVSMLWRLRQESVDVGGRWNELAELARKRARDCSLVFASLHHLLTTIAVGDQETAGVILAAMAQNALSHASDQARVARDVGVELAQVLSSPTQSRRPAATLNRIAAQLDALGGSRAQRDVFLRTLALMTADAGETRAFDAIARLRGKTSSDRFEAGARARMGESPSLKVA